MSNILFLITIIIIFTYVIYKLKYYNILTKPAPKSLPRILLYHSIGAGKDTTIHISAHKFEQHIKYLKDKGYKFYTVSEIVAQQLDKSKIIDKSAKKVVITIDDGYANNYHDAFPILKKYGAKATIYIAPEMPKIAKLSNKQIKEMAESGLVEFGAHTMSHVRLTETDDKLAYEEILASKKYLEELLQTPCKTFAYPYGYYNEKHAQICRKIGFESAVTTEEKISQINEENLFTIPRTCIRGRKNLFKFYIALTRGCYRFKGGKHVHY